LFKNDFRLISVSAQQTVTLYKAIFDTGYIDDRHRRHGSANPDSGIESSPSLPVSGSGSLPVASTPGRFVPVELLLTTNKVHYSQRKNDKIKLKQNEH
jgi:hypothetical protein